MIKNIDSLVKEISCARGEVDKIFILFKEDLNKLIENGIIVIKEGTFIKDKMWLIKNEITREFEEYYEIVH